MADANDIRIAELEKELKERLEYRDMQRRRQELEVSIAQEFCLEAWTDERLRAMADACWAEYDRRKEGGGQ